MRILAELAFGEIEQNADYGPFNEMSRHKVNMRLITENWDDILRLAGSLKLGRVRADGIMRTLQVADRPTQLAKAVAEFGRIDKTIHSLTFIDDKNKRRGTLTQINRTEGRHRLAREVFHGRRGELRQRYRNWARRPAGSSWARGQRYRSLEYHIYGRGHQAA